MPFLEVEHLTKVYGTGANQVKALDDVNFTVEKGQFVAIVGPSGSGKSTLMHLLGGVDRPTSGSVRLSGMDLAGQPDETLAVFRRRQIGLVYQFYNLIPLLTVKENLLLPLLLAVVLLLPRALLGGGFQDADAAESDDEEEEDAHGVLRPLDADDVNLDLHAPPSGPERWDVLGLGQAMVDFSGMVDDEFLHRLGIQKGTRKVVNHEERGRVLRAVDGCSY